MMQENLHEERDLIKEVLEPLARSDLSSTARLVACLEALGVSDLNTMVRFIGIPHWEVTSAILDLRKHQSEVAK